MRHAAGDGVAAELGLTWVIAIEIAAKERSVWRRVVMGRSLAFLEGHEGLLHFAARRDAQGAHENQALDVCFVHADALVLSDFRLEQGGRSRVARRLVEVVGLCSRVLRAQIEIHEGQRVFRVLGFLENAHGVKEEDAAGAGNQARANLAGRARTRKR